MKRLFEGKTAFRLLALFAFACAICFANCAAFDLFAAAPDDKPDDFAVDYTFANGSVPPPHHYKYNLKIASNGAAEIALTPGYDEKAVAIWTKQFAVAPERLDDLYQTLRANEFFTRDWRQSEELPTGGSHRSLSVKANIRRYALEDRVIDDQRAAAANVFAAVENVVPQAIRDEMTARHKRYEADFKAGKIAP